MRVDLDNSAVEAVLLDARRETLTENGLELGIRCQANAPEQTGRLIREHDVQEPDAEAREIKIVFGAPYSLYVHEGWSRESDGASYQGNPWATRSIDQMAAENV